MPKTVKCGAVADLIAAAIAEMPEDKPFEVVDAETDLSVRSKGSQAEKNTLKFGNATNDENGLNPLEVLQINGRGIDAFREEAGAKCDAASDEEAAVAEAQTAVAEAEAEVAAKGTKKAQKALEKAQEALKKPQAALEEARSGADLEVNEVVDDPLNEALPGLGNLITVSVSNSADAEDTPDAEVEVGGDGKRFMFVTLASDDGGTKIRVAASVDEYTMAGGKGLDEIAEGEDEEEEAEE
ncbi:MAG: hypothetical protein ISS36_03920 [Candidatus Aenigmarchaeota archaeon]|nr:hypothetical protein [Candidatus Aenigmarchaeota archaeon]